MKRGNKYKNIPTEIGGIRFSSKAEGRRYLDLKLLERAGEISELKLQPKFDLIVDGVKIARYFGDFAYLDKKSGERIVEDVKGYITTDCKLKLRLMWACHKIDVRLVAA